MDEQMYSKAEIDKVYAENERLKAQVESQGNWIRTANRVMSKLKKENK